MKPLIIFIYLVSCYAIDLSMGFEIRLPSQVKLLNELKENHQYRQLEATGTWENIVIHFEYIIQPSSDILEQTNTVLEIVKTFFGRNLLIKRQTSTLEWLSTYETDWQLIQIPTALQKSYEADVVYFVSQEYDESVQYIARAAPVIFEKTTGRPIFCLMLINKYYFSQYQGTDAKFEAAVQIVIHESIHGLGFVTTLYSDFYDSDSGSKYNQTVYQRVNNQIDLPTPRLKQLVENHFGCSNVIGATMEDQGSSGTVGSHFERSIFQNEIMTGTIISGNTLFTEFTFTLLEDTGFYRATAHKSDIQIWGKDKGCDFYKDQCFADEQFQEFCDDPYDESNQSDSMLKHLGCSYAHTGIAVCLNDGYVECPYYYIMDDVDCRDASNKDNTDMSGYNFYFGYDSMCIKGQFATASSQNNLNYSCYQYSCDENNSLTIIVDGVKYDCSEGGSQPDYDKTKYSSGITCPDNTKQLCEQASECPNQCNRRGYCLGGTCTCQPGYSGRACDQTCTTYRNDTSCVTTCPENTVADENSKYCIGCPANCLSCTAKYNCTECADQYKLVDGFCDPEYSILMNVLLLITLIFQ